MESLFDRLIALRERDAVPLGPMIRFTQYASANMP
jgi:hypothetical protein